MTKWQTELQCGAAVGLALLFSGLAFADEALRESIHRDYKHQSYMLIEGPDGPLLYLFSTGDVGVQTIAVRDELVSNAFAKTRSTDAGVRTLGLTELAGVPDPEALDIALSLLTDSAESVRDEAKQLILDHPQGAPVAEALGLEDEYEED